MEIVYGPPNFGETPAIDQKRSVPFLIIDRPIDICANTTDEFGQGPLSGVSKIQVVYPINYDRSRAGQGSIRGELQRANNAFHYTPVILIVSD